MKSHEKMLQELLDLEEGLSDWEVSFLEDLPDKIQQYGRLTPGQIDKLEQIYNDRIVEGKKAGGHREDQGERGDFAFGGGND